MAKVPDKVIFGIDTLGHSINYGFVRSVTDNNELINLLRLRLKVFFIDQVQSLQNSKAAFPLTTMTCVGIETLGEIFVKENKDDTYTKHSGGNPIKNTKRSYKKFGRRKT
jgi:hypothetical protein